MEHIYWDCFLAGVKKQEKQPPRWIVFLDQQQEQQQQQKRFWGGSHFIRFELNKNVWKDCVTHFRQNKTR